MYDCPATVLFLVFFGDFSSFYDVVFGEKVLDLFSYCDFRVVFLDYFTTSINLDATISGDLYNL